MCLLVRFKISLNWKSWGDIFSQSSLNNAILGVLMGITNMAATIPGFLVPAVVGALTHGKVCKKKI